MMNPQTHWKRWLTVLVLVPILILIIFKGGTLLFAILVLIAGLISMWEYFSIVFNDEGSPVPLFYPFWGYLTGAGLLAAAAYHSWPGMVGALCADVVGVAAFSVLHFRHTEKAPLIVAKQVFGVLYVFLLLGFAILIHGGTEGPRWLFFVIWVIAWGDAGAFYAGSYLGRHKLCPAVSPKKTIEGAVAGLLSNLVSALLYKMFIFHALPLAACLIFALAGLPDNSATCSNPNSSVRPV